MGEGEKKGRRKGGANWPIKMKKRISDHILQMLKDNYSIL